MDHDPMIAGPRTKSALALIERRRRQGRPPLRLARLPGEKMPSSPAQPSPPPVVVASKIGDVSRQFGLTLRTIRLYEEMGLITCGRCAKNSRVLDDRAKARLSAIVDLKRLGLKISEISDLLGPDGPKPSVLRSRLEARLSVLDQQRAGLSAYLSRLPAP
jgi:DNA-binding transcriptional MerR regulator